nr:MAG TPA: hypothetical protein [Microviridae sp.]
MPKFFTKYTPPKVPEATRRSTELGPTGFFN